MKNKNYYLIHTTEDNRVPIGEPVIRNGEYGIIVKKQGATGFISLQKFIELVIHNADKK